MNCAALTSSIFERFTSEGGVVELFDTGGHELDKSIFDSVNNETEGLCEAMKAQRTQDGNAQLPRSVLHTLNNEAPFHPSVRVVKEEDLFQGHCRYFRGALVDE